MAYKYITSNNLNEKQAYTYSEYRGIAFIKDYLYTRQSCLDHRKSLVGGISCNVATESNPVKKDLAEICRKLKGEQCSKEVLDLVNWYTKSFEVRKRLYTKYDETGKPENGAGFEDYENYLMFADCLVLAYKRTGCLKYFSCLLKVDDTLLSIQDRLSACLWEHLRRIIGQELAVFFQLANEKGIGREVTE